MSIVEHSLTVKQQLEETVEAIRQRSTFHPRIGLILGSGLGGLTNSLQGGIEFEYGELPHLVPTSAPGHEGKLMFGTLGKQRLAVLSGRFHFYEGYDLQQVTYPVRLVKALGAEILIITSIVGSMHPKRIPAGSLVLLEDHINLMGANPLIGPNDETLGPRFPDLSQPYDAPLRKLALQVAKQEKLPLREGIYVAVSGPNLETRAEYRFLRQIGADVVGMSMVPEVITAVHASLRVLAVTVVSDECDPAHLKPAILEELLRIAAEAEPKLTALLKGVITRLGSDLHRGKTREKV